MKYILVAFFICSGGLSYCQSSTLDIDSLDDAVVAVFIYDFQDNYVGHGSGFFVNSSGLIVTNYHVVKEAFKLKVGAEIKGERYLFEVDKIISGDENKDLATIVLKNDLGLTFPFLRVAKDIPAKGSNCWAIGTPANLKYMNTVSKGLVSNLSMNSSPRLIQTNAEITHGSSGGALIDENGFVIGVTSAGDESKDGARASINFAIWIGELDGLPTINKSSLITKDKIPAQISFYTSYPYKQKTYLYIDGYFIDDFDLYFPNEAPACGQKGTISRYFYPGTHLCQIYYAEIGKWVSSNVVLNGGECQLFHIGGPDGVIRKNIPENGQQNTQKQQKSSSNLAKNKGNSITLTFTTKKSGEFTIGNSDGMLGTITRDSPLSLIVDKNTTYYFSKSFVKKAKSGTIKKMVFSRSYQVKTGLDDVEIVLK